MQRLLPFARRSVHLSLLVISQPPLHCRRTPSVDRRTWNGRQTIIRCLPTSQPTWGCWPYDLQKMSQVKCMQAWWCGCMATCWGRNLGGLMWAWSLETARVSRPHPSHECTLSVPVDSCWYPLLQCDAASNCPSNLMLAHSRLDPPWSVSLEQLQTQCLSLGSSISKSSVQGNYHGQTSTHLAYRMRSRGFLIWLRCEGAEESTIVSSRSREISCAAAAAAYVLIELACSMPSFMSLGVVTVFSVSPCTTMMLFLSSKMFKCCRSLSKSKHLARKYNSEWRLRAAFNSALFLTCLHIFRMSWAWAVAIDSRRVLRRVPRCSDLTCLSWWMSSLILFGRRRSTWELRLSWRCLRGH